MPTDLLSAVLGPGHARRPLGDLGAALSPTRPCRELLGLNWVINVRMPQTSILLSKSLLDDTYRFSDLRPCCSFSPGTLAGPPGAGLDGPQSPARPW